MILLAYSEGPDQTARMRSLIWAFHVRIFPKTRFRIGRPIYEGAHYGMHELMKARARLNCAFSSTQSDICIQGRL